MITRRIVVQFMKAGRLCPVLKAQTRFMQRKQSNSSHRGVDAMLKIMRPLPDAGSAGSEMEGVGKDVWNCFPNVVTYCYELPGGKDISFVKHVVSVTKPFEKYLVTMTYIRDLQRSKREQVRQTLLARKDHARLQGRTERRAKKVLIERIGIPFQLPKIVCPFCLYRKGNRS